MELEAQWWTGQLAADIHQALRYKVGPPGGGGGSGQREAGVERGERCRCRRWLRPSGRVSRAGHAVLCAQPALGLDS